MRLSWVVVRVALQALKSPEEAQPGEVSAVMRILDDSEGHFDTGDQRSRKVRFHANRGSVLCALFDVFDVS